MLKAGTIIFVVNQQQPDFIGKFVNIKNSLLALDEPLSIEYDGISPILGTTYMPIGGLPDNKHKTAVHLPLHNVLYFVEVEKEDTMGLLYQEAMDSAKREAEEEAKAAEEAEAAEAEAITTDAVLGVIPDVTPDEIPSITDTAK